MGLGAHTLARKLEAVQRHTVTMSRPNPSVLLAIPSLDRIPPGGAVAVGPKPAFDLIEAARSVASSENRRSPK